MKEIVLKILMFRLEIRDLKEIFLQFLRRFFSTFEGDFSQNFNVQIGDSRFEGDRPRQLWRRQFWQVEGHRCGRQGLDR